MMDNLFNSYTKPVPPLRYDVQRFIVRQNGHNRIYFHDNMGYATPDFTIPTDSDIILSLIDGAKSVEQILRLSAPGINKEQILGYIRFLDENALLESAYFRSHSELIEKNYEETEVHYPTTAGISYPSDPAELEAFLNDAFQKYEQTPPVHQAKALYAPHIDPRVGMADYVKSFSSIRELTPKRVVILGTSHYAGLHDISYQDLPFIFSRKTFRMPNGDIHSDQSSIDNLLNPPEEAIKGGMTDRDRAHRIEHSIELHLLFLNHIWQHTFEIVPVLVGGFPELLYSKESFREQQIDDFSSRLKKEFADDEETFFLISGDLSHFGQKFGDRRAASSFFEEVKINDQRFLDIASKGNPGKLISLMREEYDPYRICGFPPLLIFMKVFEDIRGEILSHNVWDERERESAVSFGSILYQ